MEGVTITVVVFALLLFIAAAAAPAIFGMWRRVMAYKSDLQIWKVMRRRGITPDDAAGKERELVMAAHRCIACPSIPRCDAWLASGRTEGAEEFCPNYKLLEDLGAARRRAARR